MNRLTWLIACFFAISMGNKTFENNYFEGSITYRHDVVSKNDKLDSSLLKRMVGNGATLFFKEGNYLHKYDGSTFKEDLYRKEDNKIYFRKFGSDTTRWTGCGNPGDKILKLSFTPKKEKILGIDCDELVIYYKDNVVSDYYNSDSFRINPAWLKNFLLDGENVIDQKEKAVCLKHKVEYENFAIIETATKFSRKKLDDRIFRLSPNEILVEQKPNSR